MTAFANHYMQPIPKIEGATATDVTYHVASVADIKRIVEEVDAREAPTWDVPSLFEHHYEDDGLRPERWILAVRWEQDGIRFSAQSPSTSVPSLVSR